MWNGLLSQQVIIDKTEMERFTNNRDKLLDQLKMELLDFNLDEDWVEIFSYVEFPFFLRYAYSYNWSFNPNGSAFSLRRKEWNAAYDMARFNKGIYNLDRLAIVEKEIPIQADDSTFFKSIDLEQINTVKFDGIVLDGLICELKIAKGGRNLNWNIDEEMNTDLNKLISTMRNWKREMKEL